MPPSDLGPPLKEAEIAILEQWVREGATYDLHWSLRPVRRPAIPNNVGPSPIDKFIDRRLGEAQLTPNPAADKSALVRRVTLALTGLPPTLAEVDAFVQSQDPRAYQQLVERLLSSPAYGETMGACLVRYRSVCRLSGLCPGSRADHLAVSRLGHRGVQPQQDLRSVHD